MFLFETEKGDKWVCIHCVQEQEDMIKEKSWEYILEDDDPTLRCSLCKQGEFDYED